MRGASRADETQSRRGSPGSAQVSCVASQPAANRASISITGRSWSAPPVEAFEPEVDGMSSVELHAEAITSASSHPAHR